jgi:hypothetical protein
MLAREQAPAVLEAAGGWSVRGRNPMKARRANHFAVWLLLIAASGLAQALPPGYKDDFNGCATQSPDTASREECCKETFLDCSAQCNHVGPNESLACRMECLEAMLMCDDGRPIPIVTWPGNPGSVFPGLVSEGDRLVAQRGRELVASQGAVLVELRGKDASTAGACVAFAVACQCPYGSDAKDMECRAAVDGKGTACRICKRGAAADTCKPCPDCRPELLSAQPCDTPDLRAPRVQGAAAK